MRSLFRALLLAAALAAAAAQPARSPAEEQTIQALQLATVASLGPATEAPTPEVLLPAGRAISLNEASLGRSYKVRLQPAAGVTNTNTYAIFEYWPRPNRLIWKLTIFNVENFIGAHLHLDPTGGFNGPIVALLVPENAPFLPDPGESYRTRTYNGVISNGSFQRGVYNGDYRGFIELIRRGSVYINTHSTEFRGGLVQAYLREV